MVLISPPFSIFCKVFDYVTGHKIDTYDQIHELSITCISFYEPSEYLITGAKDGSIKVWNVRKSLLFDFHDHYNAITGFMIVENICHDNWGTLPLIVSASLDSTIRMWNIETGQLLYRVETTEPCLGLNAIRKNLFYHFTETTIQLWNFNRFYHTFAVLLSKAFLLKKYKVSGKPARLLAASTNGSIQLLSILSGTNLGTGFPTNKELTLSQVEYDFDNEIIYALNTNGTITVYDSTVNPFQITQLWNNARNVNKETIECICGADFYHYEHGTSKDLDERLYKRGELLADYVLFGGTDGGQIHQIIFEKDREKNEPIIQVCLSLEIIDSFSIIFYLGAFK
jgi:WD40 repeat protein